MNIKIGDKVVEKRTHASGIVESASDGCMGLIVNIRMENGELREVFSPFFSIDWRLTLLGRIKSIFRVANINT